MSIQDKRVYLVDGSGFIFRAFHALPPMTRPDGTPVNAVYGFCAMLQKLLDDLNAERLAVIFDAGRQTFRQKIYPEYKAHRPPPPDELIPQFALIRQATLAYGLPAIEAENYEADDLIAAYAKKALAQGLSVRIVSADKDLMQLVREGVELYDPMKSKSIAEAEVLEKFGVPPEKVVDVQALAGDSTDNVPGVPGIGIKTAAQLINEYGSLENLLQKAAEIKQPKRRELLQQNAELALISKKLVTLDENAPTPLALEELQRTADHKAELAAFLTEQGFRSLLARLKLTENEGTPQAIRESGILGPEKAAAQKNAGNGAGSDVEHGADEGGSESAFSAFGMNALNGAQRKALGDVATEYVCLQTAQQLKEWLVSVEEEGRLAVDTETTSLTPSTTTLVGISLATKAGRACYIPISHIHPETTEGGGLNFSQHEPPAQIPVTEVAEILRPYLVNPAILKIGHNLKFDMQVLAQHQLAVTPFDDTMLLSFALGAGAHGHGLDELALRHFQHQMISFEDVTGTGKSRIGFERVALEPATMYAAEDADYTLRLWQILKPELAVQKLQTLYDRIEKPLVPVVAEMERHGICVDRAVLAEQSRTLAMKLEKLEQEVHGLAPRPFNIASPKQLGEILFGEMKIVAGGKSKTGAYSTAIDVLEPLAEEHEIVAKVLAWRGLAKLKSTYTDTLPQQIDARTGRVHTSYSLVGAATGRLSSNDPNLQNIPIKTEEGRAIRRAFIAPKGCQLLSVDYSQIELRLAASVAGIKALIEAFQQGVDIHALTASQVFGIPLDAMTPEKRRMAKAVNFGIIYGISGFGLSRQLGIAPGEAAQFIRDYLDRFPELRDWMESTKTFARSHGYVETLFGRRIHIAGISEKNPARRAGAERQAINAPLQGTAADIMKRAMIRVVPALAKAGLAAKLLLQVHDELVFEVPETELEATIHLAKTIMQEAANPAVSLAVPLVAEAGYAANWAQAH